MMPFWCIQDNECLACRGGCEGYETKREAMRERRSAFWKAYDEVRNKETIAMGHCPQETKQALYTDKLLYRETTPESFWDSSLCLTRSGGISINIDGYVIAKTLKEWHTLAVEDFKRQKESQTNIGAKWGEPQNSGGILGMDFSKIEERVIGSLAPDAPVKPLTFAQKLIALLNEHNKEKGSNTPDFVLALYLTNCLGNFEAAIKAREAFYGVSSRPGSGVIGTVDYKGCTVTRMDDEHTHAIEMNARQASNASLLAL